MNRKPILFVLRLTCFFLFVGRAWQHIIWDAPFRVIFWDESLLKPIVESIFATSWDSYATSMANDEALTRFSQAVGVFYAACALLCLAPFNILKSFRALLPLASLSLSLLAFIYSKDKFYELGMFIEFACQFLAPLFLYFLVSEDSGHPSSSPHLLLSLKLAIALTFVGHGLYAAGYYSVPGSFIDMTIGILGVSQGVAVQLLFAAGLIDFAIAGLIFVPRLDRYALVYAAAWGLLTSMARTLAYFDSQMILSSLNQWLPETLMRMPHVGIPLCALGWASAKNRFDVKAFFHAKITFEDAHKAGLRRAKPD